jgi:hypothetical protein
MIIKYNLLKNNYKEYLLGQSILDTIELKHSPYTKLCNAILGEEDFIKKQNSIFTFCQLYTRIANDLNDQITENNYWLYCIETGVQLIPSFLFQLAFVFIETPDKYISMMDKIIKEMTSKRNYEVEQINRNNSNNNNNTDNDNWLKPQETSIKKDKFITEMPKKNVSWGENVMIAKNEIEIIQSDSEEDNIFKKLKKVNTQGHNVETLNNIKLTINEPSTEDKIKDLQNEMKLLNTKLDKIMDLLNKNNK